jgi:hypothetical protein
MIMPSWTNDRPRYIIQTNNSFLVYTSCFVKDRSGITSPVCKQARQLQYIMQSLGRARLSQIRDAINTMNGLSRNRQ